MIIAVSPATDEARELIRELIRELDTEFAALYPGLPINGIDAAEFPFGTGLGIFSSLRIYSYNSFSSYFRLKL